MLERCLDGDWMVSDWCLDGIWEVSENCSEGVCEGQAERVHFGTGQYGTG